MKVALISLARRGGMVHFQVELANSLGSVASVLGVCAADVGASSFRKAVQREAIDTGRGALGSLARAVNPFAWIALRKLLHEADVDVCHIVSPHEWNPILALVVRSLGKPLIYTVHDPSPHIGAPLRMRIAHWISARLADALVVLTRNGRRQLLAQGFRPNRVFVIPLGVFTSFVKQSQDRTKTENLLLFFGRIEPYKGLEVLLSAFSNIQAALPGWKLMIAGVGRLPGPPQLARIDSVEFVNRYVSDEEVAVMMRRARLVVLPYLEATQSAVVTTAYAFGKPVVVTRVGGLPDMVVQGKTGLVIPPNDSKALGRAMKSLAGDPVRLRRMGRLAYSISRARWSSKTIAAMHGSMYEKVLAWGRTP